MYDCFDDACSGNSDPYVRAAREYIEASWLVAKVKITEGFELQVALLDIINSL